MATKKAAKKTTTQKHLSNTQKAEIGIGLTAAAVTAAGAYFLYGSKNAEKNRKKVKGWALKAKGEILEALEKAEDITEEEFNNLVEGAAKMYGTVKNASKGEVADFKKEMTAHWKDLKKNQAVKKIATKTKKQAKKVVKKAAKTARKVAKKATKKVAKKAPAKKKATKKVAKKATKKTTKKSK